MTELDLKQKIVEFFNTLTSETMDSVSDFYATDCEFHDPVVDLNGVDALRSYYAGMYENVQKIRFEFGALAVDGKTVSAPWIMYLTAKKLKGDGDVVVPGLSHIIFNEYGQVKFHRDYFDLGAFVYEHVPLLGGVIRFVKKKLHP